MKTKILLLLFIASFVGIGCSSNKKSDAAPPAAETPPVAENPVNPAAPGGGGTGGGLASAEGDVVDFVPVDFKTFESYVGTHPLNSPKNIKLSVNLKDNGSLRYYGTIKVSYEDNGQTFQGVFESGSGKNQNVSGLKDNDVMESVYNFWYNTKSTGKLVFSGLYQDQWGSIVLVVDKSLDQGDGQGSSYVSGSVYFKNFAQSFATQSPYRKCWFIYVGPHDCRSNIVMSKSDAIYPSTDEGYRKLGTFSGMSRVRAFNLK